MDYNSEFQPGPLLEIFNTTTNADAGPISRAGDARYRLYKVAKNKPDGDAARAIDKWSDWPGDLGAPYIDVDSSGTWNADTDVPDFRGDQMMWCVFNDVNQALHTALGNTRPMGVEIQTLYFVFNQPGALGNIMFMKWRIINKSDADYEDVYIGMWSDVDLGQANDDLPGCDTTLSLGYVYNGDNDDEGSAAYGTKPPAVGFDFFQGPIVPGAPTDSALFAEKWRHGYRNLPATAFVVYCNNTFPQLVDPPDGDPDYALQAYDYLKGKAGTIHQYVIKSNGDTVKFFFSGDPVAGTGDLPSNFPLGTFAPQDVRIMLASGPFTLAQGDTQEIVGSIILAQGSDRLNSVTLLKGSDQIAQNAFNDNFNVPGAPPLPDITVTELPNQLIFEWQEKSVITEAYDFRGNKFEGYNFYQGESANGPWKKLATYDIINGVTMIEDLVFNQEASKAYLQPVQFGTDSGIKRNITVNQDAILSTPLVNGKPYYFALTTYSYNPDPNAVILGVPVSLEAAKDAIVATPQGAAVGSDVPTASGQVLAHSRSLDDVVIPEILNPAALNGSSYSVVLNGVDTSVTSWSVVRSTGGVVDTSIANSTDFTGGSSSPIVDGVQVRVSRPVAGVRRDTQPAPAGYQYTPSSNMWTIGRGTTAFDAGNKTVTYPAKGAVYGDLTPARGAGTKVAPNKTRKIELRFSTDPAKQQNAYRYLRNVRSSPAPTPARDSSFIPYILVRGNGFVYQRDYAAVTVPFTAWEVDSLDGSPEPRQVNVGFLENNDTLKLADGTFVGKGKIDGKWEPTSNVNAGDEALYIFESTYSTTEDPRYNRDLLGQMDSLDIMYIMHAGKVEETRFFTEGDVIAITPNYVLEAGRAYSYVGGPVATAGDAALAKEQMANINVFPNPYFANNLRESGTFNKFVTFTNLPRTATIKIFTLTGELVRSIQKEGSGTLQQWDLRNANGLPVASGIYIAVIEIPDAGNRILKLAVIMAEERPTRI
jgi:hypothetical protein